MRTFVVVAIFMLHLAILGAAPTALAQQQSDPCSVPAAIKLGERDPCVMRQNERLKTMQQELGGKVDEPQLQKALSDKADKSELENRLTAIDKKFAISQGKATFNVDRLWVLLAAVLVFFMQAGGLLCKKA